MTMRVAEEIMRYQVPPGAVAIWWLGQNSYLLKSPASLIMVDPFFSRPGKAEAYLHAQAPLRAEELRPDAVFCTHAHSDHTDPGFLSALASRWPGVRFFGPPESAQQMTGAGIAAHRVTAVAAGEVADLGTVSAQVVLSKTAQVSDVAHLGYIFGFGGACKVYNTGDIMRGVMGEPALAEPLRGAAPEVALLTTSPTEQEFPDFAEAAALAREIGARVAIPAHYGCFSKRTFDPAGFAAQFAEGEGTRAVIIPYCGVYLHRAEAASA